jgi:hypothetical protein
VAVGGLRVTLPIIPDADDSRNSAQATTRPS